MSRNFELITPIRLARLTRFMRVRRVDVSVHWSVLVISVLILLGVARRPLVSLIGLTSYLSVLVIHECGHVIAAQRRGCHVFEVELYPIFGITRFETPWSRRDHCVIAWGGVLAQFAVSVPLIMLIVVFGYTRINALNAALAILGPFSLGIALFNLLPLAPLDGATAWRFLPALFGHK